MYKLLLATVIVSTFGFAAELTTANRVSDVGIENFVSAFGKLGSDHPIFEDQSSGDVFRVKLGKKTEDEKWINTAKQIVHRSNAAAKRSKISEGSLRLSSAKPSKKSLLKAFNLVTGRIKDNATEEDLKDLLDAASLKKNPKNYVLYSGDYDTSSNSCEVVVVQDLKNSEAVVVTTCYNE